MGCGIRAPVKLDAFLRLSDRDCRTWLLEQQSETFSLLVQLLFQYHSCTSWGNLDTGMVLSEKIQPQEEPILPCLGPLLMDFSVPPASSQIITQRLLTNYESSAYSLDLFLTSSYNLN